MRLCACRTAAEAAEALASEEYISPGGGRGLQNRWVASDGVTGGFDSHVLPPDRAKRGFSMTVQSVTLNVPSALYDRLERRAAQTHRTVEDVLLDVLATAVPLADDLPPDLAEALSPLALLDDAALWRAARSHLSAGAS